MVISINVGDGLCVTIDTEGPYSPDILDDAIVRARDLFRLTASDMQHLHAEHEPDA